MCDFCEGKLITVDYMGDGYKNAADMINFLSAVLGEGGTTGTGIRLVDKNKLSFDNSANEYADGLIEIQYCPFCGRKLEGRNEEA